MTFIKGQPKPPGSGRKGKGRSPNKTTAAVEQGILALLTEYHDSGKMKEDFEALDPKDRIIVAEKYTSYIAPKRQAVDGSLDINTAKDTIDETLTALAEENE